MIYNDELEIPNKPCQLGDIFNTQFKKHFNRKEMS